MFSRRSDQPPGPRTTARWKATPVNAGDRISRDSAMGEKLRHVSAMATGRGLRNRGTQPWLVVPIVGWLLLALLSSAGASGADAAVEPVLRLDQFVQVKPAAGGRHLT